MAFGAAGEWSLLGKADIGPHEGGPAQSFCLQGCGLSKSSRQAVPAFAGSYYCARPLLRTTPGIVLSSIASVRE